MCCSVLHKPVTEFSLTWKFQFLKVLFIQNFREHVGHLSQILEEIYMYACEIRILQDYCNLIKIRVLPSVILFLFPTLVLAFSTSFSLPFSLSLTPHHNYSSYHHKELTAEIVSLSLFFQFYTANHWCYFWAKKITGKNDSPNILLLGKVVLY